MNINELEQAISDCAKTRKAIHDYHRCNIKEGCIDITCQQIIDDMKEGVKKLREYKKIRKEIEEAKYKENRQKIKII